MRTHVDGEGVLGIKGPWLFAIGAVALIACAWAWWFDVIREANKGDQTPVVQLQLRYGMILFIASEVMFFVAWFWAYFDSALLPGDVHELMNNTGHLVGLTARNELYGGHWPPAAAETAATIPGFFKHTFDPWGLPLVNTLILLTSGCTVTWAHHSLLKNDRRGLVIGLVLTVLLGMTFTVLQAIEYSHAGFSFAGHTYGSTFFMATGFHGAHVIIGTIFLAVCSCELRKARSRRSSTSGSRRLPGTGTSSTWCGCSCSPASTFGAPEPSRKMLRQWPLIPAI